MEQLPGVLAGLPKHCRDCLRAAPPSAPAGVAVPAPGAPAAADARSSAAAVAPGLARAARPRHALVPPGTGEVDDIDEVTTAAVNAASGTSSRTSRVVVATVSGRGSHGGGLRGGALGGAGGAGRGAADKGICINGWLLFSNKSHIAADGSVEALSSKLGFTPPEILFDTNCLVMCHAPSGLCITLTTPEALAGVRHVTAETQLKVPVAKAWERAASKKGHVLERIKSADRDWTYCTDYHGACRRVAVDWGDDAAAAPTVKVVSGEGTPNDSGVASAAAASVRQEETTTVAIPFDMLRRPDPILWYDDVTLFEDELHDHGDAKCSIKVRVMPACFFVLLRFWLRVDGLLLRLLDTRIFHKFGSPYVQREITVKEATFAELESAGHSSSPKEYTDPQKFDPLLQTKSHSRDLIYLDPARERGDASGDAAATVPAATAVAVPGTGSVGADSSTGAPTEPST